MFSIVAVTTYPNKVYSNNRNLYFTVLEARSSKLVSFGHNKGVGTPSKISNRELVPFFFQILVAAGHIIPNFKADVCMSHATLSSHDFLLCLFRPPTASFL